MRFKDRSSRHFRLPIPSTLPNKAEFSGTRFSAIPNLLFLTARLTSNLRVWDNDRRVSLNFDLAVIAYLFAACLTKPVWF